MFKYIRLLFLVLLVSGIGEAYSQVSFSGDARFRPRYDVRDRTGGGGELTQTLYHQYRARLRMKADIGEGWLFQTMVSGNELGYYSISSNEAKPSGSSNLSAGRTALYFMEMYMGQLGENSGFKIGLFLMGAYNNPIFDLHFYPAGMIDIPYFIFNTDGAYGFWGYHKFGPGKLTGALLIDDNAGIYREDVDGNELSDSNDNYTLYLHYNLPLSENISVAPMVLASVIADDSSAAPITFGAEASLPNISTLSPSLFFGYTMQGEENIAMGGDKIPGMPNNKYSGWLARGKVKGKLGPGSLLFWIDYGSRTDELAADVVWDFYYHWLSYTITLHKGEYGDFSVSPEWRMIQKTFEGETVETRHKIEFRFDIKFK